MVVKVNDYLLNEAVDHAVDLSRYSNWQVNRMRAVLEQADADLYLELQSALDRLPSESFTVRRLEAMLENVRRLLRVSLARFEGELDAQMRQLVEAEMAAQKAMIERAIPDQIRAHLSIATPDVAQVFTAATEFPMQGALLHSYTKNLEATIYDRMQSSLATGYVEGLTVDQMVRRLRGTRAAKYSDGIITGMKRRHAEAIVRTSVAHYAAETRNALRIANKDLFKAIKWVSTLDMRTTPMCQLRDGLLYSVDDQSPIGHKVPWLSGPGRLHWNCRSTWVPVLKSYRELGVPMDEVPVGKRASMDGQVPDDLTYKDWLAKQTPERQLKVLGRERFKLYKKGVEFDRFFDDKGKFLTLEEFRGRSVGAGKAVNRLAQKSRSAVYVDSKTRQDAEKLAHSWLESPERYRPLSGGINLPRRFSHYGTGTSFYGAADYENGFGIDAYNTINRALADAQNYLDSIGVRRLQSVMVKSIPGFNSAASMGDGMLCINPSEVSRTLRSSKISSASKWKIGMSGRRPMYADAYFSTPEDKLKTTIWHEIGHHVHQQAFVKTAQEYKSPPLENKLRELFSERVISGTGPKPPTLYAQGLSSYSGSKQDNRPKEWFAESFALHRMGRDDLVDPELLKLIGNIEKGIRP